MITIIVNVAARSIANRTSAMTGARAMTAVATPAPPGNDGFGDWINERGVTPRRRLANGVATAWMIGSLLFALIPVVVIVVYVVSKGAGVMSVELPHRESCRSSTQFAGGGIAPAIVGTLVITGMAALLAIPLGVLAAVYLNEYGRRSRIAQVIRFMADVMTGVPSIVMGLFVATIWVSAGLHLGYSGFAGSLALAALMLPIVIRSCEEMLKLVPDDLRQASDALGARRWRTVVSVVIPAALPGMVSGAMLAVARAAGETAPLLFTIGVTQVVNANPFHGTNTTLSAVDLVQRADALPECNRPGVGRGAHAHRDRVRVHRDRAVRRVTVRGNQAVTRSSLLRLVAEIPFQDQVLTLGIAGHALAIAAELGVVDREQLQASHCALTEFVDRPLVAEHPVDLPVGRDRARVDDPHVPLRRNFFELFGVDSHHVLLVRRRIRLARTRIRPDSSSSRPLSSGNRSGSGASATAREAVLAEEQRERPKKMEPNGSAKRLNVCHRLDPGRCTDESSLCRTNRRVNRKGLVKGR